MNRFFSLSFSPSLCTFLATASVSSLSPLSHFWILNSDACVAHFFPSIFVHLLTIPYLRDPRLHEREYFDSMFTTQSAVCYANLECIPWMFGLTWHWWQVECIVNEWQKNTCGQYESRNTRCVRTPGESASISVFFLSMEKQHVIEWTFAWVEAMMVYVNVYNEYCRTFLRFSLFYFFIFSTNVKVPPPLLVCLLRRGCWTSEFPFPSLSASWIHSSHFALSPEPEHF